MPQLTVPRAAAAAPAAALWSANFRRYFGARTASLLGDAMLPVALSVGVLRSGYGTAGVGYALGAWTAAVALGVLFGGVLADRFTPRRMMVLADLVRLAIQAALAAAFALGTPALGEIVALQFATGLATALFQPGVAGLMPQVAGDVQRANGVLRIAESLAGVLGPALAGVLVSVSGPAVVFALYAATYGFSAACLLALRLPAAGSEPGGESFLRQLVDGWQEFRTRAWLWGVISIFLVYGCLVVGLSVPVGNDLVLTTHGSTALGVGLAAMGVGGLVGGGLAMRLRLSRPLAFGAIGWVLFAGYPLTAALRPDLPLLCLGWGIAGAGLAFWSVIWATTVQTQVPGGLLNRISAYDLAGSLLPMALGRSLAGPLARLTGERPLMLLATGAGLLCGAALVGTPAIRRLRAVR
ncbi:MFS transporter [Kitasatospora sp. NBC_01287]|uniref:MFS transporter n=1 Tax=Kitasatospora sp. NBC_01287 TaxID=2903573 RepID=UPI00225B8780|nr:MFS transporter [Kitasatospora sp. NBC_01287]MCX4745852.1 MFS transporter [Kitasatospora sp. NBC_01287]